MVGSSKRAKEAEGRVFKKADKGRRNDIDETPTDERRSTLELKHREKMARGATENDCYKLLR